MSDLIVDDEYIKALGSYYKGYAKRLQDAIDDYTSTVERIVKEAVMFGEFKEALVCFQQQAAFLRNEISTLGVEIEQSCNSFIEEIDEKDKYLY